MFRVRLTCCVYGCEGGITVSWWRALWAMARTLSPRPYVCRKHRDLFEDPP